MAEFTRKLLDFLKEHWPEVGSWLFGQGSAAANAYVQKWIPLENPVQFNLGFWFFTPVLAFLFVLGCVTWIKYVQPWRAARRRFAVLVLTLAAVLVALVGFWALFTAEDYVKSAAEFPNFAYLIVVPMCYAIPFASIAAFFVTGILLLKDVMTGRGGLVRQ